MGLGKIGAAFSRKTLHNIVNTLGDIRAKIHRETDFIAEDLANRIISELTSYPERQETRNWKRGVGRGSQRSQNYGGPPPWGNPDSWSVGSTGDGIYAETEVTYAPFLVSNRWQAHQHMPYWKTLSEVFDELGISGTEIDEPASDAFERALNKIVKELADSGRWDPSDLVQV